MGAPLMARRVRDMCRLTGQFTLRSGRSATEYFDKYQFEADPGLLDEVARSLFTRAQLEA